MIISNDMIIDIQLYTNLIPELDVWMHIDPCEQGESDLVKNSASMCCIEKKYYSESDLLKNSVSGWCIEKKHSYIPCTNRSILTTLFAWYMSEVINEQVCALLSKEYLKNNDVPWYNMKGISTRIFRKKITNAALNNVLEYKLLSNQFVY